MHCQNAAYPYLTSFSTSYTTEVFQEIQMKNLTTANENGCFCFVSALLRCLRTIDLCLVTRLLGQSVGSIDKGPKTSVTQLLVYVYNILEEQRPELHLSAGVKSHICSCCVCRLVLFTSSLQSVKVVFNQSSFTLSNEHSFSKCGFQ